MRSSKSKWSALNPRAQVEVMFKEQLMNFRRSGSVGGVEEKKRRR